MGRTDIWKDGINTRFSRDNQPLGRGRPKLDKTFLRALWERVAVWKIMAQEGAEQKRAERNARRRERYRAKKDPLTAGQKNGPGEPPTRPNESGKPPTRF